MNKKLKHIVISTIVLFGPLTVVMEAKATGRLSPNYASNIKKTVSDPSKIMGNLKIPYGLESKAKNLIEDGKIKPTNIESIGKMSKDGIVKNNYYYSELLKNGKIREHVSVEKPYIDGIEGEIVTTKFKNPSGIEKRLLTVGIPSWLKGADIIKDAGKDGQERVQKVILQAEVSNLDPSLTSKTKNIIDGLKSGDLPELKSEGGAIRKKQADGKNIMVLNINESELFKRRLNKKNEKEENSQPIYENIGTEGLVKLEENNQPIYENLKFKEHTYENLRVGKPPRFNNQKQVELAESTGEKPEHIYENISIVTTSGSDIDSPLIDNKGYKTLEYKTQKYKPVVRSKSELDFGDGSSKKDKKHHIGKYIRKFFKKDK